jgi:hypothetical protein
MPKPWRPALERFNACYAIEPITGCWLWQRQILPLGYGVFCMGKEYGEAHKNTGAHRAAWRLFRGAIPAGFEVDHLCRVRACVNPDHLQLLTKSENMQQSNSASAQNRRKTHCLRGHLLTSENVHVAADGGRRCRQCAVIRIQAHAARISGTTPPAWQGWLGGC